MAPSARTTRRQQSKQQPTLSAFNRVSKSTVDPKPRNSKESTKKQRALESLENEQKPKRPVVIFPVTTKKRRRDETDSENSDGKTIEHFSSCKRTKVQLPSPPRTPHTPCASLSAEAQELVAMFNAFCKAFALHRAHNGPSAPAELTALLQSVTRLYQKRAVTIIDLQRILGFFEKQSQNTTPNKVVQHTSGPFKLYIVGTGLSRRRLVEYVGHEALKQHQLLDFSEQELQTSFEEYVRSASVQDDTAARNGPLLEFEMGAQTTARQSKTSETMKHIMSGRKSDLSMGSLSISDPSEAIAETRTIKSRTLSLFDRVKAKQLANSAIDTPNAEALRRKHAVARMAEVVEILRMKQQQKLRGYRGAGSSGKVSFAMQQIVGELKVSMAIPMADDEIKLCLEMLAKEINDGWCSIFELGATKSVVLTGLGKSGDELANMVKA